MQEKEESNFFVEIKNPGEIRKDVLGCMKDILESLRQYENFKKVRSEKLQKINELKSAIKEINRLISRLRASLPKTNIKIKPKEIKLIKKIKEVEKPILRPQQIEQAEAPKIAKPKTTIERLESELDEIEAKLNALS